MPNIYVDHDTGLDTNTGTALSPYKTLGKAASVAVSGDFVYATLGSLSKENIVAGLTFAASTSLFGTTSDFLNPALYVGDFGGTVNTGVTFNGSLCSYIESRNCTAIAFASYVDEITNFCHCIARNSGNYGFLIASYYYKNAVNCEAISCFRGFWLGNQSTAEKSLAKLCSVVGFYLQGAGANVVDCLIQDCGGGIAAGANANSLYASNNTIVGCTAGISLLGNNRHCKVLHNRILGCGTGLAATSPRGLVHGNNAYYGSTVADTAIVTPISLCQTYPDITLSAPGVLDYAGGDYSTADAGNISEYGFSSPTASKIYAVAGVGGFVPAPQNVDTIIDTATNSAGAAGTVSLPAEAQVINGVDYGPNDSLEGTYVPTYVDPDDLLEGVDRGDGTLGTYHEALTGEVKSGVAFGPSSSLTGTYTVLRDTANTPRAAQVGESIVTTLSPKPYAIAQVLCGGVEAVISGQGADSVEWVVPDGAIGDAPVVITDAQGNITYTQIRVAAGVEPTITEVSPTAGSKGDSVTLTGANFEALKGEGAVLIGGLCLTSVGWSSGRITGRLPGGLMSGLHDVTVVTNSGAIARAVDAFDVVVGATGAPLYWDMGSWDVNNWANDIPRIRVLKLPPSAKGAMVRIRIEQSANDPGFNILEMKLQGTAIKTRFT